MSRLYAFPTFFAGNPATNRCNASVVTSPAWASPNAANGRTSRPFAHLIVFGARSYCAMNRSAARAA